MCPAVKRQVETGDINVPTIWAGCHEDSALNFTLPYLVRYRKAPDRQVNPTYYK